MSKLVFSSALTPALFADKPLADKTAPPDGSANNFAALLLEQMSEGTASWPAEGRKTSHNERAEAATNEPATPEPVATAASPEIEPALQATALQEAQSATPPATPLAAAATLPPAAPSDHTAPAAVERETAARHDAPPLATPPFVTTPSGPPADKSVEPAGLLLHAAPQAQQHAAPLTAPPVRKQWQLDRNLPRETTGAALARSPNWQPDAQRVETATLIASNEPATGMPDSAPAEPPALAATNLNNAQTTVALVQTLPPATPLHTPPLPVEAHLRSKAIPETIQPMPQPDGGFAETQDTPAAEPNHTAAQAPAEPLNTLPKQHDRLLAEKVTLAQPPQTRSTIDSQASLPTLSSFDVPPGKIPTPAPRTEAAEPQPTQLADDALSAADQKVDDAPSTAALLPISLPLPQMVVTSNVEQPSIKNSGNNAEVAPGIGQLAETGDAPAPQPIEAAHNASPTEQAQAPAFERNAESPLPSRESEAVLLKPLTSGGPARLATATDAPNDAPKPMHQAAQPNAGKAAVRPPEAFDKLATAPAQPPASASTNGANVGRQTPRANANVVFLSEKLPAPTAPHEEPPAAPPDQSVSFATVHAASEQLAVVVEPAVETNAPNVSATSRQPEVAPPDNPAPYPGFAAAGLPGQPVFTFGQPAQRATPLDQAAISPNPAIPAVRVAKLINASLPSAARDRQPVAEPVHETTAQSERPLIRSEQTPEQMPEQTNDASSVATTETLKTPLTASQAARTVLNTVLNDEASVVPPNTLPYAVLAKPQPEALLVETPPTAANLATPTAMLTTAASQVAVINNAFAAVTEQAAPTGLESLPELAVAPRVPLAPPASGMTETPVPVAPPAASVIAAAAQIAVAVEDQLPDVPAPQETTIPTVAPQTFAATTPNDVAAEPTPAWRVVKEEGERVQRLPFTTTLSARASSPGQRTFQLVLQLPTTAAPQTQRAFEHELSNPVAAAQRPTLQPVVAAPAALPVINSPDSPDTEPASSAETDADQPPIQPTSELLPEPLIDPAQSAQGINPLAQCEVASRPPRFGVELLRTTFSAIERHFAAALSQSPGAPDTAFTAAPPLISAPASAESAGPVFNQPAMNQPAMNQPATPRERLQPQSLLADLAALETGTPAVTARAVATHVFSTPVATESASSAPAATDEWLGERQIPDPPVSPFNPAGVGTLTPMLAAAAPSAAPAVAMQPANTSVPVYFSPPASASVWTTNIVAAPAPALRITAQPAAQNASAARWTAALKRVTEPASRPAPPNASAAEFPLRGVSPPLPIPNLEMLQPENSSGRNSASDVGAPVLPPPEASTEPAPTQPLERVAAPPPGLTGTTPLPGATGDLALPRVALEHARAVERHTLSQPSPEQAAQPVTTTAAFSSELAPALRHAGLNSSVTAAPEAARETIRENTEEPPRNVTGALAPSASERGTAVAQQVDMRDVNDGHVARQLAEPLINASAELAPNEPRTIRLKLRPRELGQVEIELRCDTAGRFSARLTVEREQTTQVLRSELAQLRATLEQAGLQVGQLDINTSPDQPGQGWHAGGQDSQHAPTPPARIPEAESFDFEPVPNGGATSAADRLINLLA